MSSTHVCAGSAAPPPVVAELLLAALLLATLLLATLLLTALLPVELLVEPEPQAPPAPVVVVAPELPTVE